MSQEEKYSKIIEGLAEIKGTTLSMKDDIVALKEDSRKNTKDLETHILGVETAQNRLSTEIEIRDLLLKEHEAKSKERHNDIDERLKVVEFLPNLGKSLWKVLKVVGGLAATAVAISKFMGLW